MGNERANSNDNNFDYWYKNVFVPFIDGIKGKKIHDFRFYYTETESGENTRQLIITDEKGILDGNIIVLSYNGNSPQDISIFGKGINKPVARFYPQSGEVNSDDWIDIQQYHISKDSNIDYSKGNVLLKTRIIDAINNGCNEDNYWSLRMFLENVVKQAKELRGDSDKTGEVQGGRTSTRPGLARDAKKLNTVLDGRLRQYQDLLKKLLIGNKNIRETNMLHGSPDDEEVEPQD